MSHKHPQDSVIPEQEASLSPDLAHVCRQLRAAAPRPLAIIDVDEVLSLFVQGFDRYLRGRGHELRITSFTLFGSLYAIGAEVPVTRPHGHALLESFFADACGDLEPAPHAAAVLRRLAHRVEVVILTAAPSIARDRRAAWLCAHGFDYPMVISGGDKGHEVAQLAAAAGGPCAFVDDIIQNLDAAARAAPKVARFQLVADPHLRRLAPVGVTHVRVEDWPSLEHRLESALLQAAPTRTW